MNKTNFKIIISSFLLVLFVSTSSFAQRPNRMHHKAELATTLELTEEQQAALQELKKETRSAMQAIRNDESITDKRAAMQELRLEQEAAIEQILTPIQLEKLASLKAEKKEAFQERKSQRKATKEDMKAYKDANIKPELLQQRQVLENQMDQADIATINSIRTAMQAKKEERKAERKEMNRPEDQPQRDRIHRSKKGKGHARKGHYFEDHPEQLEQLKAIAKKYETELRAIQSNLAAKNEEWKEDLQDIRSQNREESLPENTPTKHPKKEERKVIRFLLMDVNASSENAIQPLDNLHQTIAFPNPAMGTQTLEFEVQQAGNVRIDIVDKQGNLIQAVADQYFEAGQQRLSVDTQNLKGYVFYYRIQDASGVSSTKFLVKQ